LRVCPIERKQLSNSRNASGTSGKLGIGLPCKFRGKHQSEALKPWNILKMSLGSSRRSSLGLNVGWW
jgi:hypothetical protein